MGTLISDAGAEEVILSFDVTVVDGSDNENDDRSYKEGKSEESVTSK